MKRLMASIIALLLVPAMLFAVVPVSKHVGRVNTFPDSESITAKAIEALRKDMDAAWFEKYTTGDKAIIDFWSEELLKLLPLENLIAGEEKDGAVSLYDLEKQVLVTLCFNDEGLISAIDIEK